MSQKEKNENRTPLSFIRKLLNYFSVLIGVIRVDLRLMRLSQR